MPSLPLLRSAIPLALIAALLAGCGEQQTQAQGAAPPAPTVTVAKPAKKLVSDRDEYVGRFIAFDYVEVRARVSGRRQIPACNARRRAIRSARATRQAYARGARARP